MSNQTHTGVNTPLDAANCLRIRSQNVRIFLGLPVRDVPSTATSMSGNLHRFIRPTTRGDLSSISC